MEQLKNIYNQSFADKLSAAIQNRYPSFQKEEFQHLLFQPDWETLALKERMHRITASLYETLPKKYDEALAILRQISPEFTGLSAMTFPDYVEQYGLTHWDQSIAALENFTKYSTSEFAVRPFLILDQEKMLQQMQKWSTHENEHVRRLASEGSRPRLPWAQSIPSLKQNPLPVIPILEQLKADESLYVRKSVANHLNDISKTHPELVIELAKKWIGNNEHTDWIIKHACRTLLKKGDQRALSIFGYFDTDAVQIIDLTVDTYLLKIGEKITFSFLVHALEETKLRLEFAIDYVKAREIRTKKVFQIGETTLLAGQSKAYTKTQSFHDLSTRKHYKGKHTLTILVNGTAKKSFDFELV